MLKINKIDRIQFVSIIVIFAQSKKVTKIVQKKYSLPHAPLLELRSISTRYSMMKWDEHHYLRVPNAKRSAFYSIHRGSRISKS